MSEKQTGDETRRVGRPKTTKQILDAERKVTIMIPRPEGDNGAGMFLSINDINYVLAYDTPVEVPESIAKVYYEKQTAEKAAKDYVVKIKKEMKKQAAESGGGVY